MSRFRRRAVQDLEKEGHKAISIQDENPQIYLDDDEVVMGESLLYFPLHFPPPPVTLYVRTRSWIYTVRLGVSWVWL